MNGIDRRVTTGLTKRFTAVNTTAATSSDHHSSPYVTSGSTQAATYSAAALTAKRIARRRITTAILEAGHERGAVLRPAGVGRRVPPGPGARASCRVRLTVA